MTDEDETLGADAAAVALAGSIADEQLPHAERPTARDRVIWAGTGWCAHTHQHDNSTAALNAAVTALTIAFKDERSQKAVYAHEVLETIEDLIMQFVTVTVPLSETSPPVPSEAL